ncbi:endopeptidase La [Porphyromonas levii]|uniref:Lon protease n=1 Tax=Porphyromonas levii TaxID=28114 RepID=A0A4Y8WQW2_9PORP|nr:endopeptidase La [Porphyromonas levii]MBR8712765.1 Lon protease 2 [Porphyromonas levii]MBR8714814.1 Lon protease 2 [Porphyromonas levii]MBR8727326.1 Lon protease 2 [Porphyromonas levii]MBR8735633.1 Lon protease 2 [Porphyromonas levii]MBR8777733.1 Lon protease 2 [Porphyromonas levii]
MNKDFLMNEFDEGTGSLSQMLPMIIPEGDTPDYSLNSKKLNKTIPVLPLRDMLLFPAVTIPVMVAREKSKLIIDSLENKRDRHVLVVSQKNPDTEDPQMEDMVPIGTIAEVIRIMEVNDDLLTVVLQGKQRAELTQLTRTEPYWMGKYRLLEDIYPAEEDMEYQALTELLKETMVKQMIVQGETPRQFVSSLMKMTHQEGIVNFACTYFPQSMNERISLLMLDDIKTRAFQMQRSLNKTLAQAEIKQDINQRTRTDMDKQQKDYFLQQQMKVIKEELQGGDDAEIQELEKRALTKKWSEDVQAIFEKEIAKLQRMPSQSPDYSIQNQYIETMLDLPWGEYTKDNFNMKNAEATLNKDHFGLDKVKERILDHLAVLKLKGDMRSPIICLYGPPGVGKTSLGKSIADALKRKYVRISLGGLHDEAEIRGHRRTYIGAMPGRIIKGFLKAGSSNPVFVLDEVDKLSSDYKGDPSSALLEVLDPEQNNTFHDNYLDIDYDLSKALFIATANNVGDIPAPLRDRMEMIEVSGYIMEEKVEIATRHLIPKEIENHGLKKNQVKIGKRTIAALIEGYTRESGVRQLEKAIASLLRKVARKIASAEDEADVSLMLPITINPTDLKDYLGSPKFLDERYEGNDRAGVVTGLAWTSVGGEVLLVESAISPSKSGKLTITGNLGDVMKESAILAMEYIKSNSKTYGIPFELFDSLNVHIHVPEGAIPKDGPSAGITLVTSLISTFTQRKVKPNLAMTGEITLRGKVLPVGGIKEKILAAKRYGIKTIVLCEDNRKDIEEIKSEYLSGLEFVYVTDIKQVIDAAVSEEVVANPIDLEKHLEEYKKSINQSNNK